MRRYENLLRWLLMGTRPAWMFASLFLLFIISIVALGIRNNPKPFFPSGDPNFIYVYLKMPVGTSAETTDSVVRILEKRVYKVLEKEKPGTPNSIVESVISNVAVSANNPRDNNRSVQSNLGRVQVSFVEFDKRDGKSTKPYLDEIRKSTHVIPGPAVTVNHEDAGLPTSPPVNVEVIGDNFENIAKVAYDLKNFLDTNKVEGIEHLNMDVDLNNPEITISVDREKAMIEGLTTGQVGMEVRTAIF